MLKIGNEYCRNGNLKEIWHILAKTPEGNFIGVCTNPAGFEPREEFKEISGIFKANGKCVAGWTLQELPKMPEEVFFVTAPNGLGFVGCGYTSALEAAKRNPNMSIRKFREVIE